MSGSASYSQGVSDADGRVNTSSASYNSGYANAGFRLIVDQVFNKEGIIGGDDRNAYQSYTLTATQTTWWCAEGAASTTDTSKSRLSGQGSGILYAGQSHTFTVFASQTNGAYARVFMHITAWVKA